MDKLDIQTYVRNNQDTIYRLWKYKKVFTPYEIDSRFEDESIFEEDTCEFVKIEEVICLPNDVLIKFRVMLENFVCDDEEKNFMDGGFYIFERLSDIKLSEYDRDNGREV